MYVCFPLLLDWILKPSTSTVPFELDLFHRLMRLRARIALKKANKKIRGVD